MNTISQWKLFRGASVTKRSLAGALALLLGALAFLTACGEKFNGPPGDRINDMTWVEEVDLASGEKITIKRHVRFTQEYAMGIQSMSAAEFQTASIEMAAGPSDFVRWEAPIRAFFMDRDPETQEWVVVGGADGATFYNMNGTPCPPQWAFRLRKGIWYVQPVPVSLIGRIANLLAVLNVTDDYEFTPEAFQAQVASRKAEQIRYNDISMNGRPYGMKSVGLNTDAHHLCPGKPPQFTGQFRPEISEMPNLSHFPRLTP